MGPIPPSFTLDRFVGQQLQEIGVGGFCLQFRFQGHYVRSGKTGSVCNSLTNIGAAMKSRARPAFSTPGLATWPWLVLQGRAIDI